MDRRCPSCSHVYDDVLIRCPECKAPFSTEPRQIRLTQEERSSIVRELWGRQLTWLLGGFSVFGLASWLLFLNWVSHSALPEVQSKIVDRISVEFQQERIKATISDVAARQASTLLNEELRPALQRVQSEATAASHTIAELQESVRDQSAAVDAVAQQATTAAKLAADLSTKTAAVDRKLQEIDQALLSARTKIEEINRSAEFTSVVVAAQSDDRHAYDRLAQWGKDASFPLHDQASAAYQMIMDNHASPFVMSPPPVQWKEGIDPTKLTFADLRQAHDAAPVWLKPALIEYIWSREDIPKRDRLEFMANVVANDPSLKAVEWAGRTLSVALKANLKPLAVDVLLERWHEKKASPEWNATPVPSFTS